MSIIRPYWGTCGAPLFQKTLKQKLKRGLLFNFKVTKNDRPFTTSAQRNFRLPKKTTKLGAPESSSGGQQTSNVTMHSLVKPFAFTVAFSSGTFAACAIWQYESFRKRAVALVVKPSHKASDIIYWGSNKQGTLRQKMNVWWNNLSQGHQLFVPILFANVLVFLAWRRTRLHPIMFNYFCCGITNAPASWPMVLSVFSHMDPFHLLINMSVLYSFITPLVQLMGKEQFLAFYMTGGVISSFASLTYKVLASKPIPSLGASGAIMALIGYYCSRAPDARLHIIFLPFFSFPASQAIKVIVGLDLTGLILNWKLFDHAAHLGGTFFGLGWYYWGNMFIWQKRKFLLEWWHHLRTPKS